MIITISFKFDEKSAGWHKHADMNKHFCMNQREYLMLEREADGYLYFDKICRCFGIPCPENTHVRFSTENDNAFSIDLEPHEEYIDVIVTGEI